VSAHSGIWTAATDYIDADVNDPSKILHEAAGTLDFTQPVALMLLGILGNVRDTDEARAIVSRLVDAVPPGSYLVINDGTDTNTAGVEGVGVRWRPGRPRRAQARGEAGDPYYLRSPDMIAQFFAGLEVLEPGVVSTPPVATRSRHHGPARRVGRVLRRGPQA
jgi:hypothetical protein